jgi:Na+/H+ antiporter NhaD/arsenite permease-like protein
MGCRKSSAGLEEELMLNTIIFVLIYLLTLLLAATETLNLSVSVLTGALLMAYFGLSNGLFTYQEALGFIDMRIIGLIIGSMIVIGVVEKSGLFHLISLYAMKSMGGDPGRFFIASCLMAAIISMFLGDQASILFIGAAVATVTKLFNHNPVPYIVSAAIMTNLGGTSTLIGSTSNMVIGIHSGLSYADFISYLVPCELILWVVTTLILYLIYRPQLVKSRVLPSYNPWRAVKDRKILVRSTVLLILFIALMMITDQLGTGPEAIALGFAVIALVVGGQEPAEIFRRLDWETVFFLAGMLFLTKGFERTGLLTTLSNHIMGIAGGSSLKSTLLTIWSSGITSTVFSNTAIALVFTPMIQALQGLNKSALWSALILGTNLGGATTPLSGSVWILALGVLRREGFTVSFADFTKVGVITTVIQLCLASLYLILRFGLVV